MLLLSGNNAYAADIEAYDGLIAIFAEDYLKRDNEIKSDNYETIHSKKLMLKWCAVPIISMRVFIVNIFKQVTLT